MKIVFGSRKHDAGYKDKHTNTNGNTEEEASNKKWPAMRRNSRTADRIDLEIWGLKLSVCRETDLDVPSELSVIIPRVEMRQKCGETEIVMSSVTVVLAPRHAPQKPG